MMLEVEFGRSSFVLNLDERFKETLESKLPFKTILVVWKEEIYFSIPVEMDVSALSGQLRVERGRLFYWPIERGLCIFYGVSQPYSPVYQVGSYIGLLSKLRAIKDGTEATVKPHRVHEPYFNLTAILEKLGFNVATPFHEGERVIEAIKYVSDVRVALRLHMEDYGIYIEGEPILPRKPCPENLQLIEMLDGITARGRYSRLDLSEDRWITITAFVERMEREIYDAVNEMSAVYHEVAKKIKIIKYL